MALVVYGSTQPIRRRDVEAWQGLVVTWTGWNGTTWEISDPRSGAFLHRAGVRGLNMPKFDLFGSESPVIAGRSHRGSRANPRDVFWPIAVLDSDSSDSFIRRDSAFWETMDPDLPGVWAVRHPSGETRTMSLRFVDDGDHEFDEDPVAAGAAAYGIRLLADEPMWAGAPIVQRWISGAPIDFFDPAGDPVMFHVSEGETFANATMSNPGGVKAWLKYWIVGPTTSVVLGPGGRLVHVPFAIADGRLLVIDSDPRVRTALEVDAPPEVGGVQLPDADQVLWVDQRIRAGAYVDRTGQLGTATRWGALPRGAALPVSVSMTGAGDVRAELVPRYRRAW